MESLFELKFEKSESAMHEMLTKNSYFFDGKNFTQKKLFWKKNFLWDFLGKKCLVASVGTVQLEATTKSSWERIDQSLDGCVGR